MKFITSDVNNPYITTLAKHLDIEMDEGWNKIYTSDKTYLIWNCYGYLVLRSLLKKQKLDFYNKCRLEGKRVYVVERGALPDSVFIDRGGFLCDSDSYNEENWNHTLTPDQIIAVEDYMRSIVEDDSSLEPQINKRVTKNIFISKLNMGKQKYDRVIFVPMQYHNDTVIQLWSDWVRSTEQFQEMILQVAKSNPRILFLMKNHPKETGRYRLLKTVHRNVRIVDDIHYKDCIQYSDSTICINSGVGLQAMMWKKPVILIGKSFYQFKGINYKAESQADVGRLIGMDLKVDSEKVQRFIHYLRFVFYSFCGMQRLNARTSQPTTFQKITYQTLEGQRIVCNPKSLL